VLFHELAYAAYDVLPSVPRSFELAQFGARRIYGGGSSPYRFKLSVHCRERAQICVSPSIMLFAKLLPLTINFVSAHDNAPQWKTRIRARGR
jgi:hypothetical protein